MYQSTNYKKRDISTTSKSISNTTNKSTNIDTSKTKKQQLPRMDKNYILSLALLITINAVFLDRTEALSLISEKCDPNKVGPDETTVKGGWQAEMFNGLSFRTCGK